MEVDEAIDPNTDRPVPPGGSARSPPASHLSMYVPPPGREGSATRHCTGGIISLSCGSLLSAHGRRQTAGQAHAQRLPDLQSRRDLDREFATEMRCVTNGVNLCVDQT